MSEEGKEKNTYNKKKTGEEMETISPNGVYVDLEGKECVITGENGIHEIEIDGKKMPFDGFTPSW